MHRGVALAIALAACSSEPADPYLKLLESYKDMGDPAPDTSNAVLYDPRAIALGKQLYFDTNFSGTEVYADMLLNPMTSPGRAAQGQPIKVACNTCHDVTHAGSDPTGDPPGNRVSFGGGAYDVNGQQTFNAAYSDLIYWNGRNDSLWSQIVAVTESHVSVNGSRMRVAWRMIDAYRDQYTAIWPDFPLPPEMDSIAAQKARLEADGTCILDNGTTCPSYCSAQNGPCLPRFPLEGRPGYVRPGQQPVCTWGVDDPILQPYKDAWDCMELPDQLLVDRIYVNYAKAIEAYEYTLISKDSPFDRWAAGGFQPGELGPAAERGARLFVGKAACKECHEGPLFQDNEFHNIGIPQLGDYVPTTAQCPAGGYCDCTSDDRFEPQNCLPIGARDGVRKLIASKFRRDSVWSDDADCQHHFSLHTDPNYAAENPTQCDSRIKYYSLTLDDTLRGAWKTPGLRDVAVTAPYMHNGMYSNLRDVIVAYNKGGIINAGGETNGSIDPKIKVLNLSEQEIDDLVAFLQTLTGSVDPSVTAAPVVPPDSPF